MCLVFKNLEIGQSHSYFCHRKNKTQWAMSANITKTDRGCLRISGEIWVVLSTHSCTKHTTAWFIISFLMKKLVLSFPRQLSCRGLTPLSAVQPSCDVCGCESTGWGEGALETTNIKGSSIYIQQITEFLHVLSSKKLSSLRYIIRVEARSTHE